MSPSAATPAEYQKLAQAERSAGNHDRAAAYDVLALHRAALNDDLAALASRRMERARRRLAA